MRIITLLFFVFLIASCKKSDTSKDLKPEIEAKTSIAKKENFFENERKKAGVNSIKDIHSFIVTTLKNQELEWDYLAKFCEGLVISTQWEKISRATQAKTYVIYGKSLISLREWSRSAYFLEKVLTEYQKELKMDPQSYMLANLDLAYCYESLHKDDISNEYNFKALKIAEKYQDQVNAGDYLTIYNNLIANYSNLNNMPEVMQKYKIAKERFFDSVKFPNEADEDYKEILMKKIEIKALLSKNDTENAYKKLKEFKDWKPKFGVVDKNNNLLSTFAWLIDRYDFDYEDFNKSLELSKEYYQWSFEQEELPIHRLLSMSKLARSYGNLKNEQASIKYITRIEREFPSAVNDINFYSLKIMKAISLSELNKHKETIQLLDSIYPLLTENFMEKKIEVQDLYKEDYSDLNSGFFINNFATSSTLYYTAYKATNDKILLDKAESLVLAASKMFQLYYKSGGYDYYITNYSNKITTALLNVALTKYADNPLKQREYIEMIEKNASQQLFNQFQAQVKQNNPKIKSLFEQSNVLESRIDILENELLFVTNEKKVKQLDSIKLHLKDVESKTKLQLKNFASVREDFSMQNIQNQISVDEALVKFYATNHTMYRLAIEKNKMSISVVGEVEDVGKVVLKYLTDLKNPATDYKAGAKSLYKLLCKDIASKKVNIIPQNFICYLPFETLINEEGQNWIQSKNINYNFSLPLWYAGRVYDLKNSNQKTLCLAADYSHSKVGSKPIMYSEKEVDQIAALTGGDKNIKSSKQTFIENANRYTIYHLALHAELNDENFEQSNLLFSDDEPLYFKDFYSLSLPFDLVVLSACNTGSGKIVNGEGIMSLSRALTFSGTRSSVVSLWQVPDKETSEIMISFYENLKSGQAKDVALANAKTTFMKINPMKNHPFYWAGFVVNGDVSPIMSGNNWMIYLGIGLGIFILFLVFKKKLEKNIK